MTTKVASDDNFWCDGKWREEKAVCYVIVYWKGCLASVRDGPGRGPNVPRPGLFIPSHGRKKRNPLLFPSPFVVPDSCFVVTRHVVVTRHLCRHLYISLLIKVLDHL